MQFQRFRAVNQISKFLHVCLALSGFGVLAAEPADKVDEDQVVLAILEDVADT